MNFTPVANGAATSAAAGHLAEVRLAVQTTGAATSSCAAWPYVMTTAGDLVTGYPYFDVPAGWPVPVLPGP